MNHLEKIGFTQSLKQTTHRQLLEIPDGGVIIDTPGMRELKIESADLSSSFRR